MGEIFIIICNGLYVFFWSIWKVLQSMVLTMGTVWVRYSCRWNVFSTRGTTKEIIRELLYTSGCIFRNT